MLICCIHQLYLVVVALLVVFVIRENEIEDAYSIDAFQIEVPFRATLSLFADRKRGIEHAAVFE